MAARPSGLAAGVQAGSAFGPWGAAIGGAAGLVGDMAMQPDTGISQSGTGQFDLSSMMDGSGWTVSTGSSKATGATRQQTAKPGLFAGMGGGAVPGASMAGLDSNPLMLLLILGMGLALWRK
ncbi:MAG: hypothetical protein K2W93_09830 [Burkholderiaceae bacterium]|nr:hypothetical protein [Burkholderiaceae bacterium]